MGCVNYTAVSTQETYGFVVSPISGTETRITVYLDAWNFDGKRWLDSKSDVQFIALGDGVKQGKMGTAPFVYMGPDSKGLTGVYPAVSGFAEFSMFTVAALNSRILSLSLSL